MELYVHIPFCKSKCRYCDFASYAGCESQMERYVDTLLQEAALRQAELPGKDMETVFVGGGTPSLLPAEMMDKLLEGLTSLFPLAKNAEFTCEANPGTLTRPWLDVAMAHGMNRLSMGMQACQPELLQTLGRIHRYEDVCESVSLARNAGVTNISIDLMFGLPGQTPAMWRESLQAALRLEPQHLSCYGLIPEEGTPLVRDLDAELLRLPEEEDERRMYDDTLEMLAGYGFVQYEISNFAKPGYACRHNLGYWRQVPYLGLGAAASSMLAAADASKAYTRQTNPAALEDYFAMVEHQRWADRTVEDISPAEARFETMMLGLRTTAGVSVKRFEQMHGFSLDCCYGEKLTALRAKGLVTLQDGWWRLTRRGMDVQNAVLVELMDD